MINNNNNNTTNSNITNTTITSNTDIIKVKEPAIDPKMTEISLLMMQFTNELSEVRTQVHLWQQKVVQYITSLSTEMANLQELVQNVITIAQNELISGSNRYRTGITEKYFHPLQIKNNNIPQDIMENSIINNSSTESSVISSSLPISSTISTVATPNTNTLPPSKSTNRDISANSDTTNNSAIIIDNATVIRTGDSLVFQHMVNLTPANPPPHNIARKLLQQQQQQQQQKDYETEKKKSYQKNKRF